ncbi:DinB family protein [Flavobacterium pallidum]|uniref:DinB family protein n=1 Tax=Flavobacterium pallidum TaxID=2172098 RepID=A0A2S1SKV3_9FLAO|nr:DinB family protein [Flavobacterium pallidum]AWI27040.1 DinB family protein [Flavobacterium pallidum]
MTLEETMIKMTFDRWNALLKQFNTALESLTDEQLQHEISPGRNRGIYLLGHLTAVHDSMVTLLDLGERLYPEMQEIFINKPDKSVPEIPSAADLRQKWQHVGNVLDEAFANMQPSDWFQKHTAVTAEDFAGEPYRNKLNIIVTRASHLAYHLGQFILIK